MTYEDVTNIDAVGLITARSGIKVTTGGIDVAAGGVTVTSGGIDITTGTIDLADGARVRFGGDQDLQVYHTGSNAFYEILLVMSTLGMMVQQPTSSWELLMTML